MKRLILKLAVVFHVILMPGGIAYAQQNTKDPLNVIVFMVDDLGWRDLGCMGSTYYETPHDRSVFQRKRDVYKCVFECTELCSKSSMFPNRTLFSTARNIHSWQFRQRTCTSQETGSDQEYNTAFTPFFIDGRSDEV